MLWLFFLDSQGEFFYRYFLKKQVLIPVTYYVDQTSATGHDRMLGSCFAFLEIQYETFEKRSILPAQPAQWNLFFLLFHRG